MVSIKGPEDNSGATNFSPLSSGISQVASGANVGLEFSKVGAAVERSGEQFFQAADKSFKDASYNRALSNATLQYNNAYDARLQQRMDDKGNPTYTTLASDTGAMGKNIMNTISAGLFDPEVKARFTSDFGRYVNNKQLQALNEARQQHIDYSTAELVKAIKTNIEAGIADNPANINYYVGQNDKIIQEAQTSGILSAVDAQRFQQNSQGELRVGSYRKAIDSNPYQIYNQLKSTDATKLGLDHTQQEQLIKEAAAGIKDREAAIKKQQVEQQKLVDKAQNLYSKQVELQILRGDGSEKQIIQDVQTGRLSDIQGADLQLKLQRQINSESANGIGLAQIEEAKKTGVPIVNASPKLLDRSYSEDLQIMANSQQDPTRPLNLTDKAMIASSYNTSIPAFNNELAFNLVNSQQTDATGALRAYEHMADTRPVGLDALPEKAHAIGALALTLSQNTNVTDSQALEVARKTVLEPSDVLQKQTQINYRKESAFQPGNLEDTIINKVYDKFDFKANSVAPQDQVIFSKLFEQNYALTNDKNAAIQMTKAMVHDTFGPTVINDGLLHKPLMFYPPEKLYPTVQPEAIKKAWELDQTALASINNVDKADIGIIADSEFKQAVVSGKPNEAAYLVVNTKTGQALHTDNGDLARWRPTLDELKAQQDTLGKSLEAKITTAKVERKVQQKISTFTEQGKNPFINSPTTITPPKGNK